jgi:hypothetical protein
MFSAYVVLAVLTALAAATGAWLNFTRHPIPVAAARHVHTPDYLHDVIGALFLAAASGLLLGLAVRPLGIAAAGGLVVFFVLAVLAHLRVNDSHLGAPLVALTLATTTLVVTIAA